VSAPLATGLQQHDLQATSQSSQDQNTPETTTSSSPPLTTIQANTDHGHSTSGAVQEPSSIATGSQIIQTILSGDPSFSKTLGSIPTESAIKPVQRTQSLGAIIGGVLAGLLFLALIVLYIVWRKRSYQVSNTTHSGHHPTPKSEGDFSRSSCVPHS
jgi:hypothetical protein